MVSTGQNPARVSERLPIIAIRQLGQSTASPAAVKKNDAAAAPDGLSPRRPEGCGQRTKPFCGHDETGLKPRSARMAPVKQRGAVMLEIIINLFYRQSCRAALSAIRRQHRIWA